MPTIIRTQVRFAATSLKTEDDLINTWHFQVEALPPAGATLGLIADALKTFYDAFSSSFIGDWSTTVSMKFFNLADPPPRIPITTLARTLLAFGVSATPFPREPCVAVSFKAIPVSGVPAGRRRGRIYLPPFNSGAYANTGLISSTTLTTVKNAANALLTASDAAGDWTWGIYSRVNGSLAPVTTGYVDDAPDIQRRRGRDASTRSVFP